MSSRASSSRGFKVGDCVSYKSSNGYVRTGVIAEITEAGASVDEGHPYKSWIEFKYLEPCLPTSTCFQGLAAFPLQQSKLGEYSQPNLSKSTLTHKPYCDRASQAYQYTQTSATIPLSLTNSISSVVDFLVPGPAAAEKETDYSTQNQAFGGKPLESSSKGTPDLLLSKIQKGLSTEDLEKFLPLSEWQDIRGTIRSSYQRLLSVLPKSAKDCLLCPTPTVSWQDGHNRRPAGGNKLITWLKQNGLLENGLVLNAEIVELLQGFPLGWTQALESSPEQESTLEGENCSADLLSQNKLRSHCVESSIWTPSPQVDNSQFIIHNSDSTTAPSAPTTPSTLHPESFIQSPFLFTPSPHLPIPPSPHLPISQPPFIGEDSEFIIQNSAFSLEPEKREIGNLGILHPTVNNYSLVLGEIHCPSCQQPLLNLDNACGVCGCVGSQFLEDKAGNTEMSSRNDSTSNDFLEDMPINKYDKEISSRNDSTSNDFLEDKAGNTKIFSRNSSISNDFLEDKCNEKISSRNDSMLNDFLESDSETEISSRKIRRRKGDGSGCIYWRTNTKGGKDYSEPYYQYEFWSEGDCLVKSTKYIPKRLLKQVQQLDAQKAPVREILRLLKVKFE